VLHVADHADHRQPRLRAPQTHAPAHRLFIGEVPARERLVDDDDAGRRGRVTRVDVAPLEDGDAHRAEVSGADGAEAGVHALVGVGLAALDLEAAAGVLPRERQRPRGAGRLHSGDGRDALQDLREEPRGSLRLAIASARQRQLKRQHAVGVKAGVNFLQPPEALEQQPRAD
jgi:hypothetical protein